MLETVIHDWSINPRVTDADFRPGAEAGYVRSTVTKENTALAVEGGVTGVDVRTSVIAGQARELLAAGGDAHVAEIGRAHV